MYLIIECDTQPAADSPLGQELDRLDPAMRWVDAGWARFLRLNLGHRPLRRSEDPDPVAKILSHAGVRRAWMQEESLVLAGRAWQAEDSLIEAGARMLGSGELEVIAGPCSVESEDQMESVASAVAAAGARWLRGGAWKPRSNPYQFQGLEEKGLKLLRQAADRHNLGVITEVLSLRELDLVAASSDILQVGSRNAQNFPLLKALGELGRPVMLKRGFGCTVEETLLAAEYVMSHGNPHVMLCERGIRSFESGTRFTFDINAIPLMRQASHLPVIADPSHGTGLARLVPSVARAALAAGASGLMFEVHPDPEASVSDADQALSLEAFELLMSDLKTLHRALHPEVYLDLVDRPA